MYLHSKNELCRWRISNIRTLQTDRKMRLKTLPLSIRGWSPARPTLGDSVSNCFSSLKTLESSCSIFCQHTCEDDKFIKIVQRKGWVNTLHTYINLFLNLLNLRSLVRILIQESGAYCFCHRKNYTFYDDED